MIRCSDFPYCTEPCLACNPFHLPRRLFALVMAHPINPRTLAGGWVLTFTEAR